MTRGRGMNEQRRLARRIECGHSVPAKLDASGSYYPMGISECGECGCEDFELIQVEDIEI